MSDIDGTEVSRLVKLALFTFGESWTDPENVTYKWIHTVWVETKGQAAPKKRWSPTLKKMTEDVHEALERHRSRSPHQRVTAQVTASNSGSRPTPHSSRLSAQVPRYRDYIWASYLNM